MYQLKGKFANALIINDNTDYQAINQIIQLINSELSKNSKVAIQADAHAGNDNVVGLTMTISNKVAPSLIGSDIGCGVFYQEFTLKKPLDLANLDQVIKDFIPAGPEKRVSNTGEDLNHFVENLEASKQMNLDYLYSMAKEGFATLGGGNHFIEVYQLSNDDKKFDYGIAIHTGSRSLGGVIYRHYSRKSKNYSYHQFLESRKELIEKLKKEDKESEIKKRLDESKAAFSEEQSTDKDLKYLKDNDLNDYLHDMTILNSYAKANRNAIAKIILSKIDNKVLSKKEGIDKIHNFIEQMPDGQWILRKGSQSAYPNEMVLVPINMKDGTILAKAKGNADWNYSFPHGAGRKLSRSQAKNQLDLNDFKNQMKDIYSTTVNIGTLDEAPDAYKPIDEIIAILETEVIEYKVVKPIYNFKGGFEKSSKTINEQDEFDIDD